MTTARQIASEVQRLIGETAGAGVQAFTEDGLLDIINRAFRLFFTKYSWDQFLAWDEVTLDGATGLITSATAFVGVKNFEDFLSVHREGEEAQLPILGRRTNPFRLSGTRTQCFASLKATHADYATKRLQFYPLEAIGTIQVNSRVDPSPFVWANDIPLDNDLMVAGAAWLALTGEDLNPGAAEGQKLFMDERFSAITTALARHPIHLSGTGSGVPTEWFARP